MAELDQKNRLNELKNKRDELTTALVRFSVDRNPKTIEPFGSYPKARRDLRAVRRELAILRGAGR